MNLVNNSINSFSISFTIKESEFGNFKKLLENELSNFSSSFTNISRISFVGYGIIGNTEIIHKILNILSMNSVVIHSLDLEECKISVMTKERVSDKLIEQLHHELIN